MPRLLLATILALACTSAAAAPPPANRVPNSTLYARLTQDRLQSWEKGADGVGWCKFEVPLLILSERTARVTPRVFAVNLPDDWPPSTPLQLSARIAPGGRSVEVVMVSKAVANIGDVSKRIGFLVELAIADE